MGKSTGRPFWKLQTLTSIISTSMVLVLLGLMMLLGQAARMLADSVRENLTVTLVLTDDTNDAQAHAMVKKLQRKPYVAGIQYISREQALREHVQSMGIGSAEFLESNPFSISLEVRMLPLYSNSDSLLWISKELEESEMVADVIYQDDLVKSINENIRRITTILFVIAILLVIISLSLIRNTVRLSVYSQRFTIHTMKLVGARWSFIRRPFLWRSVGIGIMATILADAVLLGAIHWAVANDPEMADYVPLNNLIITGCSLLVVGLLITVICTFISVTHYLRSREESLY